MTRIRSVAFLYIISAFSIISKVSLSILTATGRRPSVLFVVSDDLRFDTPFAPNATNGSIELPYIRKLAAKGVTFENTVSNFASCGPSRQSFLTGRTIDALGVWNQLDNFRQRGTAARTLPEHLIREGYTTISVGKVFHNDPFYGIDEANSWTETYLGEPGETDAKCTTGSYFCTCNEQQDCADFLIARKTATLLPRLSDAHFSGAPFFLAVGFRRPHLDWRVPNSYPLQSARGISAPLDPANAKFPSRAPDISFFACETINSRGEVVSTGQAPLSAKKIMRPNLAQRMRDAYWVSVGYMDKQLGHILDSLDRVGLTQETIVVFTSDHGYSLGERGFWCKQSLQDVALRVPLIFSIPWLPQLSNVRSRDPVELLDLYPTIANLLDVKLPDKCLNGVSLKTIVLPIKHFLTFMGQTSKQKDLTPIIESDSPGIISIKEFSISSYPRCMKDKTSHVSVDSCTALGSENIVYMGYSIRTRSYRYTQWRRWMANAQLADWSNAGLIGVELYDHKQNVAEADPAEFENENLAGVERFALIEATLRNQLETTVKSTVYSNRRCGSPPVQRSTDVQCTSAETELACAALYTSRCAWVLGYGCQESTFCGFKTQERVKVNKKGKSKYNLPDGAPGCSLFSSRCIWRKDQCEKRIMSYED